jgi:hypothetical protein
MLRYHVTCGLTKKVVSVDNSDNTLTAILEVFSVGPDAAYILQVLDPEFEDFVDVEDVASLPHLSKLQLLVIGNICNMLHSVCFMNEILIYRLRIGHSFLTHGHLLLGRVSFLAIIRFVTLSTNLHFHNHWK